MSGWPGSRVGGVGSGRQGAQQTERRPGPAHTGPGEQGRAVTLPPSYLGRPGGSPEASGGLLAPRRAHICGKEDSPREAELAGTAHAFLQRDPGVPWAPHSPPTERLSLPGCLNLFISVCGGKEGAVGSSG